MYSSKPNSLVGAIVFGCPGGGKSGMLGTFGVKTCVFHSSVEAHGVDSSELHKNCEVDYYNFELDEQGNSLSPAKAIENLILRLQDHEWFKKNGYKAICIDSLSEIEVLICETPAWKAKVGDKMYTDPITIAMMTPILAQLRALQTKLKIHYAVTALLDVKKTGEVGEILEGAAKSRGYGVLFHLLVAFPDRFIVGPMITNKTDTKPKPRIQINAMVSRIAKEFKVDGKVTKILNVKTKISGVDPATLPATMPANFSRVIECKVAKKFVKKGEAE